MSVGTKNRLGLAALAAVAGMMGYAARTDAATRTWDGGGADDNVNTAGNWASDTLPVLNGASDATTDDWVFAGTTRVNPVINVFPANLAQSITFAAGAGAFTLNSSSGTSFTSLGNTGTGGHVINNSSNVVTINANIADRFGNIQANTAGIVINGTWLLGNLGGIGGAANNVDGRTNTFSGQANITINGIVASSGQLRKQGGGTLFLTNDLNEYYGTTRIEGGAIQVSAPNALGTIAGSRGTSIGSSGSSAGRLELSGGTNGGVAFVASEVATLDGRQGSVSALPHIVNVGGNNTWQGGINFNTGGSEYTIRSSAGSLNITGAITSALAGVRNLYLDGDGGTGEASGGILNTAGGTMTVTKNGAGTWLLSGSNSFNGDLTVNAGTLVISGNNTTSAPARVNGGTLKLMSTSSFFVPSIALASSSSTLDVTDYAAGGGYTLSGNQLTGVGRVKGQLNVAGGSQVSVGSIVAPGTLTFENGLSFTGGGIYNAFFNGTNHSLIDVTGGTLSAAGSNDIKVVGAGLSIGQYALLKYAGTLGGDGFAGFNLAQLPPRTIASLLNNTGAKTIDLNITGVDAPKWTGANGNVWDINNAQNWKEIVSGNATTYLEASQPGDSVLFDDTATGSTTIDLQVPVSPALVTANNSTAKDYVIGGAGSINGTASVIKNGNGLFAIGNASQNTYSGGTIINAGTLQVGDATGFFGDVGTGQVTVNAAGTLKVNRNDDFTLNNNLAGTGAIRKTGTGVLTLAGTNQNYAGVITVEQGTLRGTGQVNLGSSNVAIVVLDGATFDTNFAQVGAKKVTVRGAGVNGAGALVNLGGGQNNSLENVTLAGDTTFGGTGRFDIRNLGGITQLSTGGNAYNLTKVGSNQVNLVGVTVDAALGDVNINEGIFGIETGTTGLGDPNKTVTIAAPAIFQLFGYSTLNKKIVSNGGQIQAASGTANALAGPITLNADTTFQVNSGVTLGASGVISGTGGLNKTQTGTLNLTNVNTYAGPTTVNGTLSVTSLANGGLASGIGQSSANAANLTINGATFRYLGTAAATTDRAFTVNGSSAFDASGSVGASVAFTNAAPVAITNPTTNAVTITLNGSNKDANVFAPSIGDATGTGTGVNAPVNLTKTGAGVWALPTANTFTGNVTVSNGRLLVRNNQSLGLGTNAVSVIDGTGNTTPPSVVFDSPAGVTVANNFRTSGSGSGGQNADGAGVIHSAAGSNVLTGTLTLTSGGGFSTYTADAGSTLTFAGTITNDSVRTLYAGGAGTGVISGSLNNGPTGQAMSLEKRGTGTWLIPSTTSNYSGSTLVAAGTLRVTGSIATSSGVTVGSTNGATFDAAATQTVKALTLNAGGTAVVSAGVLKIGDGSGTNSALAFGAGTAAGRLDLKTRGLIVDVADGSDAAALTTLRNQIIAGYNAGTWTGNGVASSDAVANPNSRGIGYALASEVGGGGTFMGAPVDGSAAVARFTLLGDATLDGTVDFNDLVKLAQNYNVVDGTRLWNSGDFTYDGNVDFNDLVKLAQNYNTALPTEPIAGAPADFGADLAAAFAAVPEPGALSLLGVAGAALAGRRRRKANA